MDNRGPTLVTSAVTPRSHRRYPEHYILSEQRNAIRKNPVIYFSVRYISRGGGWTLIRGKQGTWWLYPRHYFSVTSCSLTPGRIHPAAPRFRTGWDHSKDGLGVATTTKTSEQIGNRARTVLSPSTYCQYAD